MGGELLRLYDVTVGAHQTRMWLNDRDAAAMDGASLVPEEATAPVAAQQPVAGKGRLVTSNKMRTDVPSAHDARGAN